MQWVLNIEKEGVCLLFVRNKRKKVWVCVWVCWSILRIDKYVRTRVGWKLKYGY